ncbi:MAG: c-type cytochrome [Verrucomicrobiae bacterium]|nr:c-type cytochrome [Verrucomicrobiae bacterium]
MSDHPSKGKPTDQPGVVLREHVYDGIEEYDQKLPNWWLFTLYITIVFFVIYWFLYYQMGWFRSDYDRIDTKIAAIDQKRDEQLEKILATLDNDSLWAMSQDPDQVKAGHEIFSGKCSPCHAEDLSATGPAGPLPGVPLNDKEWIHGGEPMNVFNTITNGSPNLASGMIPWKTQMSPTDIAKVAAFVMNHHEKGEEIIKVESKFANMPGMPAAAPVAAPAADQTPAPAATPKPEANATPAPAAAPAADQTPAPAATPKPAADATPAPAKAPAPAPAEGAAPPAPPKKP